MDTLLIDTADNKRITVGLRTDGKEYRVARKIGVKKAQVVLSLIDALLKKQSVSLNEIEAIEVNTGPGSFTGLRVGVSVANALGFALKIPLNGKTIVEPHYE